jgi:hypothetical protein
MKKSATLSKTLIIPDTSIRRPIRPRRDLNYCYWLGKDRLYSASRVIRELGLKPNYGDSDPSIVLRAAHRGKLTEDYCYRLLTGSRVTVRARHCGSLQEGVSERVQGFYNWMVKMKPEYVDHQSIVWSHEDRVAWTRDLRVRINGRLYLVDIKCTSKPEKDWPLQLGCGLSYDEDDCDNAAILHLNPRLNKDGYRFIDKWSGRQLKAWWKRSVTRWHSNRDFEGLKAELGFESEALGFETEDDAA